MQAQISPAAAAAHDERAPAGGPAGAVRGSEYLLHDPHSFDGTKRFGVSSRDAQYSEVLTKIASFIDPGEHALYVHRPRSMLLCDTPAETLARDVVSFGATIHVERGSQWLHPLRTAAPDAEGQLIRDGHRLLWAVHLRRPNNRNPDVLARFREWRHLPTAGDAYNMGVSRVEVLRAERLGFVIFDDVVPPQLKQEDGEPRYLRRDPGILVVPTANKDCTNKHKICGKTLYAGRPYVVPKGSFGLMFCTVDCMRLYGQVHKERSCDPNRPKNADWDEEMEAYVSHDMNMLSTAANNVVKRAGNAEVNVCLLRILERESDAPDGLVEAVRDVRQTFYPDARESCVEAESLTRAVDKRVKKNGDAEVNVCLLRLLGRRQSDAPAGLVDEAKDLRIRFYEASGSDARAEPAEAPANLSYVKMVGRMQELGLDENLANAVGRDNELADEAARHDELKSSLGPADIAAASRVAVYTQLDCMDRGLLESLKQIPGALNLTADELENGVTLESSREVSEERVAAIRETESRRAARKAEAEAALEPAAQAKAEFEARAKAAREAAQREREARAKAARAAAQRERDARLDVLAKELRAACDPPCPREGPAADAALRVLRRFHDLKIDHEDAERLGFSCGLVEAAARVFWQSPAPQSPATPRAAPPPLPALELPRAAPAGAAAAPNDTPAWTALLEENASLAKENRFLRDEVAALRGLPAAAAAASARSAASLRGPPASPRWAYGADDAAADGDAGGRGAPFAADLASRLEHLVDAAHVLRTPSSQVSDAPSTAISSLTAGSTARVASEVSPSPSKSSKSRPRAKKREAKKRAPGADDAPWRGVSDASSSTASAASSDRPRRACATDKKDYRCTAFDARVDAALLASALGAMPPPPPRPL